jgi:hypothetical protein
MAKRGPATPLPGQREPHHDRPPTGQTGRPSLATLPPFGRPTGAYGHRLPHWPLTGHPGRPRLATGRGEPSPGPPPTGQRDGRGSLWPHGSSSPPLPGHLWPKGGRTPHRPPTAPHWPKGTGRGRLRPALPPTGHLRPPPADRGLRTGGPPTPRLTHWPKGGYWPPTPTHWPPRPSPTPQTFGVRWPKGGGGGFSVHRGPIRCGPCALYPLWGPP